MAEHYEKVYAGRVERWERKAVGILGALHSGGTQNIPPALETIIRDWQKRTEKVTTVATETSAPAE
jgi:hypothetical protein